MFQAQLDHAVLFRTFGPELRLFLARYVGSPAVAEDLVQDLFLAIWDRRATVRVRGSMRTYLFTAARNRALNHIKRERIADRFRHDLIDRLDERDPSVPGETDLLAAFELQRVLSTLPPRCRRIFALNQWRGMSYNQIALAFGLSVKTVEVEMGRALKELRAWQHDNVA